MGRVVLTFDDHSNIENWQRQIPLFAKHEAPATFFIDEADHLTLPQINGLRELSETGHEIGCHGLRHLRAVDAIQELGASEYLRTEIDPANAALRMIGYDPLTFCYPFSQQNPSSDAILKKIFRRGRSGAVVPPGSTLVKTDRFFTAETEVSTKFCFEAKGIDYCDAQSLEKEFLPALDRIRNQYETIVFYAHNISRHETSHFVTPEFLDALLTEIRRRELIIHRFCDLPLPHHSPQS